VRPTANQGNGPLVTRTMNRPARLEANEHAEDNAVLPSATPACNFLSGWAGRGLRVGNPRSRAVHQREQETRRALPAEKIAYGLTVSTGSREPHCSRLRTIP
jgi:hypothetical protein